jgi:hypothetical protein
MERKEKDKSGQFDQQKQQREKLQGGSKNVEQDKTRKAEPQRQGGGQQGGGQGYDRDLPRRDQNFDAERQAPTTPGRRPEQGPGQSGTPRQQPGVGGTGGIGTPGQRST